MFNRIVKICDLILRLFLVIVIKVACLHVHNINEEKKAKNVLISAQK